MKSVKFAFVMAVNLRAFQQIEEELNSYQARLVAVSKMKPVSDIQTLYDAGQRIFGENYVQEMVDKASQLPSDIAWHFIGHLQRNKVKYIAPFVSMIHGVDSMRLLEEIDKQAQKSNRPIDCLLQVYVAQEETKFGMDVKEVLDMMPEALQLKNVRICGLMGMASNTADEGQVSREFAQIKELFDDLKTRYFDQSPFFTEISMGMSGDYKWALSQGSTLVRIGSMLFGSRSYI
jgi:pyridoxal phosphate enzyme (YggS family)